MQAQEKKKMFLFLVLMLVLISVVLRLSHRWEPAYFIGVTLISKVLHKTNKEQGYKGLTWITYTK